MPIRTVLIAEDQEDNRLILEAYLRHAGYRVLSASDGQECLDLVRRERPDLVVMDVSMPRVTGLDATRSLKADPELSSIPIVAFTAHAMAGDREQVLEAGFDSYIAKPCEPRVVLEEIRRCLGPET